MAVPVFFNEEEARAYETGRGNGQQLHLIANDVDRIYGRPKLKNADFWKGTLFGALITLTAAAILYVVLYF